MKIVCWILLTTGLYVVKLLLLLQRMKNMAYKINEFRKTKPKTSNYPEYYILTTKSTTKNSKTKYKLQFKMGKLNIHAVQKPG